VIEHGKKIVRIVSGSLLLVVGIALSVPGIPGPGVAVVILGLSVLSTDFEFARRWMTRLKNGARRVLRRDRNVAR
jgi:tellurite resistance protein TerC